MQIISTAVLRAGTGDILSVDIPTGDYSSYDILYVQEVVTKPRILNRTILFNIIHVT